MRLSHNMASLSIYNEYSKAIERQNAAIGRISSGQKVSAAKDGPNVIAQSERLRMEIRGMQMSSRNSQDGMSMLQTNEGAMDSITSMIQRVRELADKWQNGSNNPSDQDDMKNEISQMFKGIDDVVNNTEFNDVKLINGGNPSSITMPIGSNVGDFVEIPRTDLHSSVIFGCDADALTDNDMKNMISKADGALNTLLDTRGKYGALENRFEENINILNENCDRTEMADSSIRDTDIATEMIEYSKESIITQTGNALMVQTNKFPQDVLQILANIKSR